MNKMEKVGPVFYSDRLYAIDEMLLDFLKSLSEEDWHKKTVAGNWTIKDVAGHLLDGNLRALSMLRDEYFGDSPSSLESYDDLVKYLNRLNADWVKAMKRISPEVLTLLLSISGTAYCDLINSLAPFEKAMFSVGWAGEEESKNWFHIAREYTEKWHHQQQMRLAVGQERVLLANEWYYPYLDTSNRALPYHYRDFKGSKGEVMQFSYVGETEKNWSLKWEESDWRLYKGQVENPSCKVIIPDEIAWKVFTKAISKKEALLQSKVVGNQRYGQRFFELIAVMA